MKTLFITTFLIFSASLAYACSDCSSGEPTEEKEQSGLKASTITLACSCSGGSTKDSKDGETKDGFVPQPLASWA